MRVNRTKAEYEKVIELLKTITNVNEISRLTGIPASTINQWKNGGTAHEGRKSIYADKLRNISDEDLQKLINESTSISAILVILGINSQNGYYQQLIRDRISLGDFNFEKMTINHNELMKRSNVIKNQLEFTINSKSHRGGIKKYILANNLIAHICSECGNDGWHNGKKLVHDLDHINGIRNDNRLENLRFLCPNCHSQQPTSNGKNRIKPKHYCECGNIKNKSSNMCNKCRLLKPIKKI